MATQTLDNTRTARWFPFPNRLTDERLRLICLPFAGGSASRYLPLARSLGPDIAVLPAQFPGRESRFDDPSYSDAAALVSDLAVAVEDLIDRPYAILGYSLGSAYAFELARTLAAAGLPCPEALFAVAGCAPHIREDEGLVGLPDDQLLELVRRWQALPPEIEQEPELLSMALNVFRIDLGTWERHDHDVASTIDCPVHVYSGSSDLTVNPAQLAAWRERGSGPVRYRGFSGGHFFGFERIGALAAAIRADLGIPGHNSPQRKTL